MTGTQPLSSVAGLLKLQGASPPPRDGVTMGILRSGCWQGSGSAFLMHFNTSGVMRGQADLGERAGELIATSLGHVLFSAL